MYRSPPPIRGNRSRVHDPEQVQTLRQFGIRLGNGHHIEELLNLGQDLPARPHLHCLLVESWRYIKRVTKPTVGRPSRPIEMTDRITSYSKNRSCVGSRYGYTLFIDAVDRNQTKSQFATCAIDLNSRKLRLEAISSASENGSGSSTRARACHWRLGPSPQGTLQRVGHTCGSWGGSRTLLSNRSPVVPAHRVLAKVGLLHPKASTADLRSDPSEDLAGRLKSKCSTRTPQSAAMPIQTTQFAQICCSILGRLPPIDHSCVDHQECHDQTCEVQHVANQSRLEPSNQNVSRLRSPKDLQQPCWEPSCGRSQAPLNNRAAAESRRPHKRTNATT